MKRIALGVAALLLATTSASAGEDSFIQRPTRIRGCEAIVKEVSSGAIAPTEWLEENKEEFKDLELELKSRHYPPGKAKEFMMGMAISICMERKGYINVCARSRGEDGDVQTMATAAVYACWKRNDRSEPAQPPAPPPPPRQEIPCEVWNPACNPQARPVAGPVLPPMSPADMAQFNEDASIISQPVRFIGDDEGGAKQARFASCASYWQSLSYNRSPEARQVLYAVRVARCMYRTNFAVLPARCPPTAFGSMLQPGCYARF
jgi:hypothetical protein